MRERAELMQADAHGPLGAAAAAPRCGSRCPSIAQRTSCRRRGAPPRAPRTRARARGAARLRVVAGPTRDDDPSAGARRSRPPLDLAVFRRMADMSNEAFFLADATAHLRYVNERALSLTGYNARRAARDDALRPRSGVSRASVCSRWSRQRSHGPMPPFEARTRRRDGVYVPTEVSLARIDFDGDAYLFGVVRDITERKQIEAVQRTFARRMLENLETERQRVARELHDDVGQAVATVGVLLHTLTQTPGAVAEADAPGAADARSRRSAA